MTEPSPHIKKLYAMSENFWKLYVCIALTVFKHNVMFVRNGVTVCRSITRSSGRLKFLTSGFDGSACHCSLDMMTKGFSGIAVEIK